LNTRISASTFEFSTLVDLLRWRAIQQPEQRIYTFLTDGDKDEKSLTYAELDRQARIIGAKLQQLVQPGDRALLIYPSGLEFIAAFFGCLYSGVIAVPVYPPSAVRSDRTLTKFRAIAQDAQARVVLNSTSLSSRVMGLLKQTPELQSAHVITTDEITDTAAEQWQAPEIKGNSLAFFQYTSGSTGIPKGVMVSHSNLLHNSALIEQYCLHPSDAHGVTWLPLYHDLGLIGGVLQPLYAGYESTIMAPTTFLQRPYRWLQAVSRKRATISGGPNFAYDLCVRKVTPEQKETLDLSSWEVAANGAEPVRTETLERFAQAFAGNGFRKNAFYPCYGLAEATLVVSAGKHLVFPTVGTFNNRDLEHHIAREIATNAPVEEVRKLVSIGHSQPNQKVLIVDPETRIPCTDNRVGEIWAAGPSVALGYWNRQEESAATFQAYLQPTNEGPFLRTGDLGFAHNGELFITGRLKDLIVIRGSNHYPQDIEKTIEACHPAVRLNGGAAFSVDVGDEERLVIVQEVERTALSSNLDEVIGAIRQAIATQHEVQVYAIELIKPGSLPKTSSGKVQRRGSKESYLEGSLEVVREWKLDISMEDIPDTVSTGQTHVAVSVAKDVHQLVETEVEITAPSTPISHYPALTLQAWLVARIAQALKMHPRDVDVRMPFAYYGMDSAQSISLAADLEDLLGKPLPPTLVYDYPTIAELSYYLAGEEAPETTTSPQQQPEQQPTDTDAIAVIGLGCRFPGANSPEEFWDMLRNGIDGITKVPLSRWDTQNYYDPTPATPGKMNTRWGGFLSDIDQFDPTFFNISPREAMGMDPQQRLLLEVTWETLENAGIAPTSLAGSQTGVFIGISSDDYSRLHANNPRSLDAYTGTGNAHSIAANRLSYFLDLHGPSVALDTACSSSLLAVHQACQSIRNGEATLAIAGGVNLILTPDLNITFSQARMMSADGHCKTFDESANGYVRGEGCGVVLLKPLSAAQRDGDTVLAVIRGSAVNQDGRSNGLTAPNGPSQEAVIRQALQNAHVEPAQISYVETHGSGTPLGDPIEVNALKAVLMHGRTQDQTCALGAVKTNVGHLESAAGIAGFIKTVLSLYKGEIFPNLHFKQLNPHISFEGTTFSIPTHQQAWPEQERRIAGVSAFGFGGTNVHVIVEAATTPLSAMAPEAQRPERTTHVLTVSAQSEQALHTLATRYYDYLLAHPGSNLADICYTANAGRAHFPRRLAILADSEQQLQERLLAFSTHQDITGVIHGHVRGTQNRHKIAFLFTGQGAQYIGMGRQLYETQPVFRQAIDRCHQILQSYLEQPLLGVLYPEQEESSPLNETAYTQPALFAIEYALTELWRSWGIEPDIVMGHSVGEYVAACVAGLMSLEDGLKLITMRGQLMQGLPQRGTMLVVFAEPTYVARMLEPYQNLVSLAVINGPRNTVISGDQQALQAIAQRFEAENITTQELTVSHAFHSPMMDPMLERFEQIAQEITYHPLRIPLVCNLTGNICNTGETLDASYWRQQTRNTVQFAAGIQTLVNEGYETFLEVGPHATLINMGKRCVPPDKGTWLTSLRKDQDNWQMLLQSVSTLYTHGYHLDWSGFDGDIQRRKLALPTYPFERQRYWLETEKTEARLPAEPSVITVPGATQEAESHSQEHPFLATHVALAQPFNMHVWEGVLDQHSLPYLKDHQIQGAIALPISAYIEMAQAATNAAFGSGDRVLNEIELKKLLILPVNGSQKVQIVLSGDANEDIAFHIYSHTVRVSEQARDQWTLHATGKIHLL
jgi:acyl transferase domain-containing protein/acyl-CoA synthetase (AMP-forming)/AMP-acid ligase II/acyl carrier protein